MGKGRAPCCAKVGLNKGSWTPEEDMRLIAYIQKYGHANWRALPKQAGLLRCGKSCRLRWINYLRPDLKRGNFTAEEEEAIIKLHAMLGNKWSKIAACLPGRTDNEIKNVWNTHLKKRVAPCGDQKHSAGGAKKKKKSSSGAEATVPSPSSASSTTTTTTNCSSGESGAEQQSNGSKEPDDPNLKDFEIPMHMLDAGFDFNMLVDPVPELYSCPSVSVPMSPCASSTSPPAPASYVDDLLELQQDMDINQDLWNTIDGDGGGSFTETTPAPWHGKATEANAATTSQEEGKEWWLENLERELGLWGPIEDFQYPSDPLGLTNPDPLPTMVQDPVTCYFQAGSTPATLQPPGTLTSNQMKL